MTQEERNCQILDAYNRSNAEKDIYKSKVDELIRENKHLQEQLIQFESSKEQLSVHDNKQSEDGINALKSTIADLQDQLEVALDKNTLHQREYKQVGNTKIFSPSYSRTSQTTKSI